MSKRPIGIPLFVVLVVAVSSATVLITPFSTESRSIVASVMPLQGGSVTAEDRTYTRRNAIMLLDVLFKATDEFKDQALKIRIKAQIADLLWKDDEPRARQHFLEAFNATNSVEEKQDDRRRPDSSTLRLSMKFQLRNEVLRLLSRHDSKLCDSLIESVAEDTEEKNAGSYSGRSTQRVELARAVADNDPVLAARMLSTSIPNGIDIYWVLCLLQIRVQDSALAYKVFSEALSVLQQNTVASYSSLMELAVYPLTSTVVTSTGRQSIPTDAMRATECREFLSTAFPIIMTELIKGPLGQDVSGSETISRLLPLYDEYMPEAAKALRNQLQELPAPDIAKSVVKFTEQDTPREMLRRAESSTSDVERDKWYMLAAQSTERQGDPEGGIAIADKIRDEKKRNHSKSDIRSVWTERALGNKDIDAAYRWATAEDNGPLRVKLFTEIIAYLLGKRDLERATAMLNDIEYWLEHNGTRTQDPYSTLMLAGIASRVDITRGFQAMHSAVKILNEADYSAPEPLSYAMAKSKIPPVVIENLPIKQGFTLLAQSDFNWALSLARAIERKEVSILAQLAVCEGLLTAPEPPVPAKEPAKLRIKKAASPKQHPPAVPAK